MEKPKPQIYDIKTFCEYFGIKDSALVLGLSPKPMLDHERMTKKWLKKYGDSGAPA